MTDSSTNRLRPRSFAVALERLSGTVARMGGLAENLLREAIEGLASGDRAQADELIARDREIDLYHARIDRDILGFLARHPPLAHDLRHAVAALKIAADLERIGDLGRNIVRRGAAAQTSAAPARLKGVTRMGRLAVAQLKRVLDAYVATDADAAMRVRERDEEIDELYNSLFREFLTFMMEDPRTIGSCTHLLFIAKNLERVGDHCTNIAETVVFLVDGDRPSEERQKTDELASP